MKITPAGLALIKAFESLKLTSYLCPAQKWTIGYGHTGHDVSPGQSITAAQAEAILLRDVSRFDTAVRAQCPVATPAQHSALVCLAFNIGIGNFQKSSVARLHNSGDFTAAARAFGLWNKATASDGVKRELRGLTRRRAAEAALYLSGDGKDDEQRTRASDVVPEKPLAQSRVVMGSTVGGAAAAASALSQFANEIEWIKDLLLPLTPYLPLLQNVFVALGLVGFIVAVAARWHDKRRGRL
jgi:lysozyme